RGKGPSDVVKEQVPAIRNSYIEANTHVQNGKLLYELGKMDESEAELKEALRIDPNNDTAFYYVRLIEQERTRRALNEQSVTSEKKFAAIEQAWTESSKREALPLPNPWATTNL